MTSAVHFAGRLKNDCRTSAFNKACAAILRTWEEWRHTGTLAQEGGGTDDRGGSILRALGLELHRGFS
jgi:hypothetical protein